MANITLVNQSEPVHAATCRSSLNRSMFRYPALRPHGVNQKKPGVAVQRFCVAGRARIGGQSSPPGDRFPQKGKKKGSGPRSSFMVAPNEKP
jgi:hypothetical protein